MKTKILILFFVLCLFNVASAQRMIGESSEKKYSAPPAKKTDKTAPVITISSPAVERGFKEVSNETSRKFRFGAMLQTRVVLPK